MAPGRDVPWLWPCWPWERCRELLSLSQPCSCQQRSLQRSRGAQLRPAAPHGHRPRVPGLAGQGGPAGAPPRASPHGSGSGSGGRSSLPGTPGCSGMQSCPAGGLCPPPWPCPGFSLRGTRARPAREELLPWGHPRQAPAGTAVAPPSPPKSWQPNPRCRRSWSCCSAPGAQPSPAPLPVGRGCHHGHHVLPALWGQQSHEPTPVGRSHPILLDLNHPGGAGSACSYVGAPKRRHQTHPSLCCKIPSCPQ